MKTKNTAATQLRIIGGKWRSRKINFIPLTTLRPTTDRTRETLFNWLAPYIVGAKCLDLFAGSGALSFESLSRGAELVVAIDNEPQVITQLKETAKTLEALNFAAYRFNIPAEIDLIPNNNFDIIFLDPPFNTDLMKNCCSALEKNNFIKPGALIYLETENSLDIITILPKNWAIIKQSKTKNIKYYLARCVGG